MRGIAALVIMGAVAGTAWADDYVGAERCGSCHEAEYKQWKQTGHARALSRLTATQQRDASCRSCHTMEPTSDNPALTGIQCESCHGAGKLYEPDFIMRDKVLAKMFGLQPVTQDVCLACHSKDAPSVKGFDFEEKVKLVQHKPKNKAQSAAPAKKVHTALASKETP